VGGRPMAWGVQELRARGGCGPNAPPQRMQEAGACGAWVQQLLTGRAHPAGALTL